MTSGGLRGFTLLEVMVSALLIGLVLVGMNSVLVAYSSTRIRVAEQTAARYIAQGEIDDVLMHAEIENALCSDRAGRSRPVYLDGSNLMVSSYFFYNFPLFSGADHDTPGILWTGPVTNWATRFSQTPGLLFEKGGVKVSGTYASLSVDVANTVSYVARLQLYGLIPGESSSGGNLAQIMDSAGTDLIADTAATPSAMAAPNMTRYKRYQSKLYVVRVYDRKTFLKEPAGLGPTKTELNREFAVLSGQVRL